MSRNRVAAGLLSVIAIAALIAFAANRVIKHSDAGFRIRPSPAWSPSRPDAGEGTQKSFHLANSQTPSSSRLIAAARSCGCGWGSDRSDDKDD